MRQQLLRFSARLFGFTLILYLLHYLLNIYVLNDLDFFYSLFAIYGFLFLTTLLIFFLLVYIFNNFQDKTGFAFMGASLLKMFGAVVFLLPMLLNNGGDAFANILSFFIPYFLFLIFETFYAVKLINSK